MKEWTLEEWQQTIEDNDKVAFYLYTPMCGTCAVASKMMDVVEQLLPEMPMGKANLNYMEQIAYAYRIESVPCLVVIENGKVTEKIYAFQSVPYLYELMKKVID
ncbi:MAG: thioredoxin family protein [Lysinibacillus sp.]